VLPITIVETAEAYVVEIKVWLQRFLAGWWAAVLLILVYAVLFQSTLNYLPYSGPFSTVDEQLTYYQVAKNFNRYGFMQTLFLQDMSSSSRAEGHPFVYNHMPPGPEILTALIMKVGGERYTLIRWVFGIIYFSGVVCFLLFARLVLGRLGLTGEGYALFFLTPWFVMHTIDHPAYSPFPLLAFLPLLLLDRHYRTKGRLPLYLALSVVFIASVYLPYQNLVMLFVSWVVLGTFQIVRFDRKHVIAFLGVATFGIFAHALQSVVLLGPAFFFKEVALAVSNRMFGIPTFEELKVFYSSMDLVHHGTHRFDLYRLGRMVLWSLRNVGFVLGGMALLVALVWQTLRLGHWSSRSRELTIPRNQESESFFTAVRSFVALAIWAIATTAIPLLMFPAYSADYGLSGMNEYFLAVAAVVAFAYILSRSVRSQDGMPLSWNHIGLWVVLILSVSGSLIGTTYAYTNRFRNVVEQAFAPNPDQSLLEIGNRLKGKVVMSNVYPTTVGFFTEEAAFGGCERTVFRSDGSVDPNQCHTGFFRGFGRTTDVRPTHYVLFQALFTGFTLCQHQCLEELYDFVAARHEVIYKNKRFTIFKLRDSSALADGSAREAGR